MRLIDTILTVVVTVTGLMLALGFLGSVHPAFDSLGHFRVHLAVALAGSGLLLLLRKSRGASLPAAGVGAIVLLAVWGGKLTGPQSPSRGLVSDGRQVFALLQLNLRFDNPEPDVTSDFIRGIDADILTLEEVTDTWAVRLRRLSDVYPYQLICQPKGSDGVAVLSRWPFDVRNTPVCVMDRVMAVVHVQMNGRVSDVAALHLTWPWPYDQARQIDTLAEPISRLGNTAILAGDFNATGWSAAVRRLSQAGGLDTVAGIGPTWSPFFFPDVLNLLGLPIDHILHKGDIEPRSIRRLKAPGSDHRALLLEFSFRP